MKTRIISAAVGVALFIAAIFTALQFNTVILNVLLMVVGVIGVYEALVNTGYVKSNFVTGCCLVYAALTPFAYSGFIPIAAEGFAVLLGLLLFTGGMFKHKTVSPLEVAYAFAMAVVITFCFWTLAGVFESADGHGLFYLILVFVAAWACDTGAYFTGYFLGKHKMAPEISPKKTVEGAVGGVVVGVLGMVVSCLIFNKVTDATANVLFVALVTPFLSFAGMMGDLVASYIKRATGIKDYGNIMPGHGGVLDRFDSVLTVAPLMFVIVSTCPIII